MTDHKRAEEALKQSEERYRHLVQYAPAGIYEVDFVNKRLKSVNDAMCQILGYSEEELLAMSPFDILDDESRRKFSERIRKGLAGEKLDETVEYKVITRDGREIWASLNVSFTYGGGKATGALVIAHDVTERKKAEERLAYQANLLANSRDAMVATDEKFIITYWNEAAEKLFGWTASEVIGKPSKDIFQTKVPDSSRDGAIERMLQNDGYEGEVLYKRKNGTYILADAHATVLRDERMAFKGTVNSFSDATERKRAEEALKESEEKFRRAIEDAPIPIIMQAEDGEVLQISKTWTELTGYTINDVRSFEEWTTKAVYGEGANKVRDHLHDLFEGNKRSIDVEFDVRTAKGEERHWSFSASSPGTLRDGRRFIVGMAVDITDRKRLEQQQAVLSEVSRELAAFKAVDATMDRIAERSGQHFDAKWCMFSELTEDQELSVVSYGWNAEGVQSLKGTYRMRDFLTDDQFKRNNAGELTIVSDSQTDPRVSAESYGALGIRSFIIVPISRQGQWRFLLSIIDDKPRQWHDDEVSLMRELADRIWTRLERARAEEALKENEERLQMVLDNSLDGINMLDLKTGHYVVFSPSQVEMTGFNAKDLEGMTAEEAYERTYPDDRHITMEQQRRVAAGEAMNEPVEYRWKVKSGEYRWFSDRRKLVYDAQGNPLALVGLSRDITEQKNAEQALKESEEKYRSLFENIKETVTLRQLVFDKDGNIVDSVLIEANPSTLESWGYPSIDEIRDKKTSELFSSEVTEEHLANVREAISLGGPVTKEVSFNERTYLSTFVPFGEDRIIVSSVDVTDLKKTEEGLRRSNEELRQFAYVASHDLQEPLRMVSTHLGLLERRHGDKLDGSAKEYMDFAVQGAERMRELINDLLAFSRLDTQAKPFSATDMNEVVRKTMENLSASIKSQQAQVTFDRLPTIKADDGQMVQLMQNLIGNAIKFHSDKLPRIRISSIANWREYIFYVQDNGIGIDSEYQEKIFEMFQRLHSRNDYEGTGIGLAIAKRIVERHGGKIWVESDGKNGSTFYFTIPKRGHST